MKWPDRLNFGRRANGETIGARSRSAEIEVAREKLRKRRFGANVTGAGVRPFWLSLIVSDFILPANSEASSRLDVSIDGFFTGYEKLPLGR